MVTQFRNTVIHGAASGALALLTLIGFLTLHVGSAAAQTIEARPPVVSVPATRAASVPVTWEITNTFEIETITAINSPGAQLFGPGIGVDGNINAPLAHGPLEPGQTARIRETMVIPQSLLLRVLQAGGQTISVERFFTVVLQSGQFTTIEGSLQINLTGGLGAGLQVSRIDLRFQNEAVQIIVPQYHPPEVRVDINYTGTGLFRAVWEVADPRVTAAGGPPIFRVLRQDRVRLGVGTLKRIKGPNLPAQLTGLHIVRFRVLDGPLEGQAPVVRYFVKAASPDGEDWWKRYIRPHSEGEGLIRVPDEPDEELTIEDEPVEPDEGAAAEEVPESEETGTPADGDTAADEPAADEPAADDTGDEEGTDDGDTAAAETTESDESGASSEEGASEGDSAADESGEEETAEEETAEEESTGEAETAPQE